MKVGFIGFGEVAAVLAAGLKNQGIDIITCLDGRSPRTIKNAQELGIKSCTNQELIKSSDIIFSTVTPSQALIVAESMGKQISGIYVDLNNISPYSVQKSLEKIENSKVVDGAIMGSVRKKGLNVKIIVSGPSAPDITILNEYGMNIEVIGKKIGQASAIKMFRSVYTKGVSALLLESLYAAHKWGIEDQVLKNISETEETNFKETAISRITSSVYHSERRYEEIKEILDMFKGDESYYMTQGTCKVFKRLNEKLDKPKNIPNNLDELFRILDNLE